MSFWQEKVVVVTGGSAGLGSSIARAFAAAGARVVIAGRDADKLARTATEMRGQGADVLAVAADITRQADVDQLIAHAVERFKKLDVLVNNVGRSARGEVLATTPEDFEQLLDLNFIATVRCTRAAAPHLLDTGGHLVNIGSLAAKSASRYLGAYPASKFALAAYTQQLRLELGPRGLHVLLVCPGPIARAEERRYESPRSELPPDAHKPGGGVKLRGLDPDVVARRIVRACERRQAELVLPRRARLLFALAQMSPRLGDWLVNKMT